MLFPWNNEKNRQNNKEPMVKKNISVLSDCYGCGVCVAACPVKIIKLRENNDGFYSPVIDSQEKCIECGICVDICAFNHKEICSGKHEPESFAGWSNDANVRQRCSSGGIGLEVGRHLTSLGFKACGVRYNVKETRAEHYVAETLEEFAQSAGSKYIPSFSADAFSQIDRRQKYFVTGTPCQIDSFRRYIRRFNAEDNFVLLDFFCHGVPSLLLWKKYLKEVEASIGPASFVSWRNKTTGWHDSWSINIDVVSDCQSVDCHNMYNLGTAEKIHLYQSRWKGGDLFYRFFLENVCLNRCCYKSCKYKMASSAADIRIGDLWGDTYKSDNKGTSAVLALTPKGKEILKSMDGQCTLVPESIQTVTEGQMKKSPSLPLIYNKVLSELRGDKTLKEIYGTLIKRYRIFCIPKRAVRKLRSKFFKKH